MNEIKLLYGKDFSNDGRNIVMSSEQMAAILKCNNEDVCKMIDDDMEELGNSWDNPPRNISEIPIYRKSNQSNNVYEMYGTLGVMMIVCKLKDSVIRRLMIRAVEEALLYIQSNFNSIQSPAQNI